MAPAFASNLGTTLDFFLFEMGTWGGFVKIIAKRIVISPILESIAIGSISGLILSLFFTSISDNLNRLGASNVQSSLAIVTLAMATFNLLPTNNQNSLEQWFGQSRFAMTWTLSLAALAIHHSYQTFGFKLTIFSSILAFSFFTAFISLFVQLYFFLIFHYLIVDIAIPKLFKPFFL